ncbi:sulfite transporter Ssu2 [Zopfia rhizophila CBS 207.26]|uniref:Sulfite transporter Ssu2 n=1 Tax=Zopfia rhizophila CBS 207.26 TaxID=1314779 RepID=A0A6A6ETJ2_9PEZI|nr:sulfite transporter Ssu2 [Zopfia rhizophila CBS 207.26]
MDDNELERIASDNPALTPSAAQQVPVHRQRSNGQVTKLSTPSGESQESQTASGSSSRKLTKYDIGWRRVVRNFTPSWFSVTMGTGIVSLIFITIPFKASWLYWLSVIFFCLNTALFFAALSISVLRYTLYPEIWGVMIADSTNSLFLGTIPIGFATLIESWMSLCVPYWGPWAVTFAWVCWIIDCVIALAVTISLTVLLISASERQALHRITAAQLLPIAATIVAAGAGAEIAKVLPDPENALGTLIASYVMWGMSTPLAMTVLVMYYTRLALHKLPPREIVVSSFLPLGPLGMGGYAIMYLGSVARTVFPRTQFVHNLHIAGDIFYILGVFIALIMWGFGLIWLCFALASIYKSRPFPFNMGWWGFTFPLGVFAVCTIEFGVQMPSLFFKVLGTIFSVAVILLWCVVAIGTVRGAWSGKLFYAPCLANLPKKEEENDREENGEREKGPDQ